MKVVETFILEVGDIFEGNGNGGGYLTPLAGTSYDKILVQSKSFIKVVGLDSVLGNVHISGNGSYSVFDVDEIIDHIKRRNIVYLGNLNGRS